MTLKDRGTIKWTSLMLVEHREALQKLVEAEEDQPRPRLDEQALTRLDYLLQQALQQRSSLTITYYQNRRYQQVAGRVEKIPGEQKKLTVITAEGTRMNLELADIIALEQAGLPPDF